MVGEKEVGAKMVGEMGAPCQPATLSHSPPPPAQPPTFSTRELFRRARYHHMFTASRVRFSLAVGADNTCRVS